MKHFNELGYCPMDEILNAEEEIWLKLSEQERRYRHALWELIGPYLVCDLEGKSFNIEISKLFFGTKYLADELLNKIIKRYDFKSNKPIWIKQPRNGDSTNIDVAKYILNVDKPEILIDSEDPGKIAVISNNKDSGIIIAFWNTVLT